jgi:hypothetical protein
VQTIMKSMVLIIGLVISAAPVFGQAGDFETALRKIKTTLSN